MTTAINPVTTFKKSLMGTQPSGHPFGIRMNYQFIATLVHLKSTSLSILIPSWKVRLQSQWLD